MKETTTKSTGNPLRKRIIPIAFFTFGIIATMGIFSLQKLVKPKEATMSPVGTPEDVNIYSIQRMKGFENIQPVFSVGPEEESTRLQPLKNELEMLIDSLKKEGDVSDVSVYVRNFKRGTWVAINGEKKYHPASLMKVPLMLAVLKTAEATPGMLEQKIVYKKQPGRKLPEQYFTSPTITEGNAYTIHELVYYSAANSDNEATHALVNNISFNTVANLFQNIGLSKPEMQSENYLMGAKDISRFMETIFNAGFLGPEYSEYAAEILENCSFNEGFSKGMPADTKIWHKFGEWTIENGQEPELHETGVFFVDKKPYLLTVMTKGKDLDKLSTVLQKISSITFRRLKKEPMSIARASLHNNIMGC